MSITMSRKPSITPQNTLDPSDWQGLRLQGHRMLDDMLDYLENVRERPVWQPIPPDVRALFHQALPREPTGLASVHEVFMQKILPYAVGNAHPGFMGWVHGGGTPVGMLAEMLAAGLNANLGGRDQIPVEVEWQVLQWARTLLGFPETASGLFVTGTSMANLMSVLVARTAVLGAGVRHQGIAASDKRLSAYTSAGAHASIAQAMDLSGLGTDALRIIPLNDRYQIDVEALGRRIAADRSVGLTPFFVAGTAGTVDVGAVDDLAALADIAHREGLWLHVDGAYGALAMLAPDIAPLLQGIERADSIAFDFHKWGQVPYDAGFFLVRDGTLHHRTFASSAAYLRREGRGMAAGSPWPCDFGPDLSRGFRALKTWFTIKVYGAERLGQVISGTCALAQYLRQRIEAAPMLELLAPVSLNIVCFRYRSEDADRVNANIVADLQESGIAAPSTTTINGRLAIRAAIVNHRTNSNDIDKLISATIAFGESNTKTLLLAKRSLPATEQLLVEGGDARISLDPERVLNRYGCRPFPDPGLVAFGSSTASVISKESFAAAGRLRRRLIAAASAESHAVTYARELDRIRRELVQLCGVSDLPRLDVVFAASGTDLHLIAAQLTGGNESTPMLVIVAEAAEIGSGVPAALAGRHFSTRSALGTPVSEGTAIAGRGAVEVVTVHVRLADGMPRQAADVDAEVETLVTGAAAMGQRVLLILVDLSKTGLIVPSLTCVSTLHRQLSNRLDILVDACQFRMTPSTLRTYLEHDFMVALTGSKFVTGPTFSGALLIPPSAARRLRRRPLSSSLLAYSTRADWPTGWAAASGLDDVANYGLLLRWEAALEELRAFRLVPEAEVTSFLQAFARAVQNRLMRDPVFEPLPVPPLDRRPLVETTGWDLVQTIFPFVLYRPKVHAGRVPLSREETFRIYQWMQTSRCQVGQPVACGHRDGIPVSALRLCISARLIVEATSRDGRNLSAVIGKALATLDKLAHLVLAERPMHLVTRPFENRGSEGRP